MNGNEQIYYAGSGLSFLISAQGFVCLFVRRKPRVWARLARQLAQQLARHATWMAETWPKTTEGD